MMTCLAMLIASWSIAQDASPRRDSDSLLLDTTIIVARIDTHGLQLPAELASDQDSAHLTPWVPNVTRLLRQLQEAVDGPMWITVEVPHAAEQSPLSLHVPVPNTEKSAQLDQLLSDFGLSASDSQGAYRVYVATGGARRQMDVSSDEVREERLQRFEEALASTSEFPLQIVFMPPDYVWRTIEELQPELPAELGGGSSRLLTEGVQWASIGVDPAQLRIGASVQSAAADSAKAFASSSPALVNGLIDQLPNRSLAIAQELKKPILEALQYEVDGSRIRYELAGRNSLDQTADFLAFLSDRMVAPATRSAKSERFKQLGLAMHNYESAYESFPPAARYRDAEGKSGLSWRVHLLPFLGEHELYQEFDLTQPWDSPKNLPLLKKIPEVFSDPVPRWLASSQIPAGHTAIQAPLGEGTIAGAVEPVTFGKITDGTSNTIFFVEVKPELAVPWTAPDDYRFDPENPAAGCELGSDGVFVATFGDGSVHFLPGDLPAETLQHLFQMNDGHPVDLRR